MGQIENMNLTDVEVIREELERLNRTRLETEPKMTFKTFPMEDLEFSKRLTAIEEKVDAILSKLTHIFGDAVLIEGKFKEIIIPKS